MMIKAFVFDLGNVIFKFQPHLAALGFVKLGGLKMNSAEVVRFFQGSHREKEFCEGRITAEELFDHIKAEFELTCEFEDFRKVYCEIFTEISHTRELVKQLKEMGYPVHVLSNTNQLHIDYLKDFSDVFEHFDEMILSHEVQCQKPDPQIYEILIERSGVEPEALFYIDDLLENVEGARKHGIVSHHFTGYKSLEKELIKLGILKK